jgi:hypothetical protein
MGSKLSFDDRLVNRLGRSTTDSKHRINILLDALLMYAVSMRALFRLRKTERTLGSHTARALIGFRLSRARVYERPSQICWIMTVRSQRRCPLAGGRISWIAVELTREMSVPTGPLIFEEHPQCDFFAYNSRPDLSIR